MEDPNAESPGIAALGSRKQTEKPTEENFSQCTESVNGDGAQAAKPLLPQHRAMLEASGIVPATMNARGYWTATTKTELRDLGFSAAQCQVPALVIPIFDVTGQVALHQIRPDSPRTGQNGKAIKYDTPKGAKMALDIPPAVRPLLGNPNRPLFITEGVKKADSAVSHGLCCIALLGVWNWRGANEEGGKMVLAAWESIALEDRDVHVVFDSDVALKPEVHKALVRLKGFLESRKAKARVIYLESRTDGGKVGLDDFFATGGVVATLLARATNTLRQEPESLAGDGFDTIRIIPDISTVVNAAERALLRLPNGPYLFQRLRQLCFIEHDGKAPRWLVRPFGAPTIAYCDAGQLRERMSIAAHWRKYAERTKEWQPALPPDWAVQTLLGRRRWEFPMLRDVITAPTLRQDGAVISAPGYDVDTGLFLDTQGLAFPPIPEHPSIDDATEAILALGDIFADFPFAAAHGRSAALAALCSLLVRPAITGNVPLFAVRATTRGTGKGLLIDTISITATGRPAPRWAQSHDDEEDRKALLTIGMEGDACVHIDNITAPLGSGPLDSALTAATIKGRLLGQNKAIEVPMTTVFFASGNNIVFAGDMARRVVPIDLESLLERPEQRDDFQYPRLLEWVRQERPRLLSQALTLLKAYFEAGCPKQGIPAYGSFEAWSDLVRSALVWAGLPDPCEGRHSLEAESDPGYENLARLLHCWQACYQGQAVTLSHAIQDIAHRAVDTSQVINTANEWNELAEALAAFDTRHDGKRLDSKRSGYGLRAIKGRVIGKQRLVQAGSYQGAVQWRVQNL